MQLLREKKDRSFQFMRVYDSMKLKMELLSDRFVKKKSYAWQIRTSQRQRLTRTIFFNVIHFEFHFNLQNALVFRNSSLAYHYNFFFCPVEAFFSCLVSNFNIFLSATSFLNTKPFFQITDWKLSIITFALSGEGVHQNANACGQEERGGSYQCERLHIIFFKWAPSSWTTCNNYYKTKAGCLNLSKNYSINILIVNTICIQGKMENIQMEGTLFF